MQGEQMLTGPIVNETKIYGGKGREPSQSEEAQEKIVISFVVIMAELGRKLTWSVMYGPSEFCEF